MNASPVGATVGRVSWRGLWLAASLVAAASATALDAVFLQRARSYFTGGFLAVDYASTPSEAGLFLLSSLLADFGVLAVFVAAVLWVASRIGAPRGASAIAAVCLAGLPVVISDFVAYELATYLGDAFDFDLMFSLAGRDVREILAVSSAHVWAVVVAGLPLLALAIGLIVMVWRRAQAVARWSDHPSPVRAFAIPLLLLGVAAVGTTALRRGSDVLDNGLRRKPTGQWLGVAVNRLSDVDGDGYGLLGRPPDTNLFDARIRPYALDIPGNGVDEDGVAGDLPAGSPPYVEASGAAPRWAQRPDVILVVLESFRADAVGVQVAGQPVTPVLDALRSRGVSVRHAYSHNGYTVQARHHIFSGSLADLRGGTSLIDDFNANGYETAYFSGQDESFGGDAFGVGFGRAHVAYDARTDKDKRYTAFSTPGSLAIPHTLLVERVSTFLEHRERSTPLFLYVNFHDTHFPYHHAGLEAIVNRTPLAQADITPGHTSQLRATYLNAAANVDRSIGRLLETVRRTQGREPAVLVTGDHGESLFDEGFLGHGYALNDAQTRIPLIAANLPITLTEPMGQSALRDAIREALARSVPPAAQQPAVASIPAGRVFQYLGNLDRPAQIAWTSVDSQMIYDLRDRRVRVNKGQPVVPEDLTDAEAATWRDLVTTWERMLLARGRDAR